MNWAPRILFVDDDQKMAKTLKDIFMFKGYGAETAHSAEEALDKIQRGQVDCVLSDIRMHGVNGVDLYRSIKLIDHEMPVVLMTAYSEDQLVEEGIEEGVITVLPKPLDIHALLEFFSSIRKEHSVAIMDDDSSFCKTLGDILRERGFSVTSFTDPYEALKKLGPDVNFVLLDMKLGPIDGLEFLSRIRARHPEMPVILVTAYGKEMAHAIETALSISAHTCLYKPFEIEQLLQVLTQLYHQRLGVVLGRTSLRKWETPRPLPNSL